jgi:hypothetical protein
MDVVTARFCLVAWVASNLSTVGCEPFSNRHQSQRAPKTPRKLMLLTASPLALLALVGSHFLGNSWVNLGDNVPHFTPASMRPRTTGSGPQRS